MLHSRCAKWSVMNPSQLLLPLHGALLYVYLLCHVIKDLTPLSSQLWMMELEQHLIEFDSI